MEQKALTPEQFGARLLRLDPEADSHSLDLDALVAAVPTEEHRDLLPHIFAFFEAFPENDAGAPGPLVHFAETFYPAYKDLLLASLERKPSHFAVLMANRILNSKLTEQERAEYTAALEGVLRHDATTESVREFAQGLLDRQRIIHGQS